MQTRDLHEVAGVALLEADVLVSVVVRAGDLAGRTRRVGPLRGDGRAGALAFLLLLHVGIRRHEWLGFHDQVVGVAFGAVLVVVDLLAEAETLRDLAVLVDEGPRVPQVSGLVVAVGDVLPVLRLATVLGEGQLAEQLLAVEHLGDVATVKVFVVPVGSVAMLGCILAILGGLLRGSRLVVPDESGIPRRGILRVRGGRSRDRQVAPAQGLHALQRLNDF